VSRDKAFKLFDEMIIAAEEELITFTLSADLDIEHKANKTLVTECDKAIDKKLSDIATQNGFLVVSEEGVLDLMVAKSGNYMTIDPIDGTLGCIEYVNKAMEVGNIEDFLSHDLGPASDFCLLIGIVEESHAKYAACYNFVTREKIFIDADNRGKMIRENNVRNYNQEYAVYVDQRPGDKVESQMLTVDGAVAIRQAALGLKSLYALINPHKSAVVVHRVQEAGLWDILPAAVAANAFGGSVLDDNGNELSLDSYIILPGQGATILKGDKFSAVQKLLKEEPNSLMT